MPAPIGLQLWSVRELMKTDPEGTLKKLGEIGYVGVEGGIQGRSAKEVKDTFEKYCLRPVSWHGLPTSETAGKLAEDCAALGLKRVVAGLGPDDMKTMDTIKAGCDKINAGSREAVKKGLTIGLHNHWWEFSSKVDGKAGFDIMLELLDKEVFFEVDTYWANTGGADVPALLARLGARAPLMHIKDGPADLSDPHKHHVAAGTGVMDIPSIVKAGTQAEWLIIELDSCATDMMTAVEQSYKYLVGKGLARGNKPV